MIKTIIIDDEPHAIDLIKGYIEKVPFMKCVESFRGAIDAIDYLSTHKIDLIFLDINMPELSGISFLQMVKERPFVILTTAYAEYALESYEYDVADYLLKPISFSRFFKSVNKVNERINSSGKEVEEQNKVIYVKDGYNNVKVNVDDILFLEKEGNYITYVTSERNILSRQSIANALSVLGENFTQIHKSFIANIHKIDSYDTNSIAIEKFHLPIGMSYRIELMKRLKELEK